MKADIFQAHNEERDGRLILEALVLNFYQKINTYEDPYIYIPDLKKLYKDHFNITEKRHGEIKNNK